MILKCKCSHEFQDRQYGLGMRVHNRTPKKNGWRCTVCGDVKTDRLKTETPKADGRIADK